MATYELTINLGGVVAPLHQSLQRARDMVAFGLHAAGSAIEPGPTFHGGLDIPDVRFQFIPAKHAAMSFDTARGGFERWVLGCGLRDAVEALGPALEEARKVGVVISLGGKMTSDDWNKRIVVERAKFDRLHLPDKVKCLTRLCGPSVIPVLMEQVKTINLARNCLVHRQGIVTDRDCNTPDGLLVQWTRLEWVVTSAEREQVVTALPFKVEAGETVGIRSSTSEKLFRLGGLVSFMAQEFSDICWTLFQFGQQLVLNLQELMKQKGLIATTESDQPESAASEG